MLIASNATAHYPILEDCFIVLFRILEMQTFFFKIFSRFFYRFRKLAARLSDSEKYVLIVKSYGMDKKKEGKEEEKSLTMPSVIFKSYRIQRTVSVSQTYLVAQAQAVQLTPCDSYERRISKLPKLQIEGLGSMRRLSLKSTLFGVDPNTL